MNNYSRFLSECANLLKKLIDRLIIVGYNRSMAKILTSLTRLDNNRFIYLLFRDRNCFVSLDSR